MVPVTLHIGPVKTGSTFVQDLLWRNREDLARQGLQHPCSHDNEMWFAVNDVQDSAFIAFDFPECRGSWATVVDRVRRFPGRSILSHEVMGLSTDEHVRRIVSDLSPRPVEVVVHARSLAGTLPSAFQEKVKMADAHVSWDDWLRRQRALRAAWSDTSAIVARWARFVPVGQIHVVTVPPPGASQRLLLDRFAEAARIDTRSWSTDPVGSNASLDVDQTELLRMVDELAASRLDVRERRGLLHTIIPHLGAPQRHRMRLIDPAERGWIEEETSRRIAALEASGAVVHGQLADLGSPQDCWAEEAQSIDPERLTTHALQLVVDVCLASPSEADPETFV